MREFAGRTTGLEEALQIVSRKEQVRQLLTRDQQQPQLESGRPRSIENTLYRKVLRQSTVHSVLYQEDFTVELPGYPTTDERLHLMSDNREGRVHVRTQPTG